MEAIVKVSPERNKETAFVREPTATAWIVTLAPEAQNIRPHLRAIDRVLADYDYQQLHYSSFLLDRVRVVEIAGCPITVTGNLALCRPKTVDSEMFESIA